MTVLEHTLRLVSPVPRIRPRHRVIAFLQTAGIAVMLLAYADGVVAEGFGRLFFSTEERRALDEMRDADVEPQVRGPKVGSKVEDPVVDVISFDGKVERSDGGSTVWVNGRPVFTGNRTAEGIRVRASRGTSGEARFELPPSDTGTTDFSLKVGQKVSVQNGRKFDAYEVRPGEDAESVLGEDAPADPAAKPVTGQSSDEAGDSGAPTPPPGS